MKKATKLKSDPIALEILKGSWYEHQKLSKDLSYVLPLDHPRVVEVTAEMNKLAEEIRQLTQSSE